GGKQYIRVPPFSRRKLGENCEARRCKRLFSQSVRCFCCWCGYVGGGYFQIAIYAGHGTGICLRYLFVVYVSLFRLPIHAAVRTLPGMGRVVPATLGLVLLAAVGLKTQQLASGPVVQESYFTSRWFLVALIEFE